ncbi:hypothetical protein LB823_10610 [Tsukamurella sp. M9C]|uniref:hypothetical protein n=1 Tax=Tsukamurella sp. M9C TaxID=2877520 RepID=UPI001CCE319E|nr:hypothetical protein [Tsukamurella sp. M9C]MCA0156652.1 hypothetical protein [Tsukamurella sp. M9C]
MTPLEQLRRWEDSGGTWTVLRRTDERAVVALLRCDGGEIVDRLESDDAALLGYLAGAADGA